MCITMAAPALNILKIHDVPYRRKFSLDKNFTKPRNLCIAGIFDGINFRQYGKGHHMLYVKVKNSQNKIFTGKTRWQNWRKYSPSEISGYMVVHVSSCMKLLHLLTCS